MGPFVSLCACFLLIVLARSGINPLALLTGMGPRPLLRVGRLYSGGISRLDMYIFWNREYECHNTTASKAVESPPLLCRHPCRGQNLNYPYLYGYCNVPSSVAIITKNWVGTTLEFFLGMHFAFSSSSRAVDALYNPVALKMPGNECIMVDIPLPWLMPSCTTYLSTQQQRYVSVYLRSVDTAELMYGPYHG